MNDPHKDYACALCGTPWKDDPCECPGDFDSTEASDYQTSDLVGKQLYSIPYLREKSFSHIILEYDHPVGNFNDLDPQSIPSLCSKDTTPHY